MGENFASAGYATVQAMISEMVAQEDMQLQAMAAFMLANGIAKHLAAHDWASFARRYNGPNYAANNYDGLLAKFFHTYSSGALPDLTVREAQAYLTYKGFGPGRVDGLWGQHTADAIRRFQAAAGMAPTGTIDDALMAALRATA